MASLTPGTLLKLLQSMNSPPSSSPSDHHRSPILQVTAIAPATADLWPSNGFYLQLSDSLNSTYVSLSDRDADSIQLGQLVHLDRLFPSHPVPRVSNLRPIPFLGRSPPPIFGSPEPLLLSLSSPSNPSSFLIQPAPNPSAPPPVPSSSNNRTVFTSKENVFEAPPPPPPKRRFSSPSASKLTAKQRPPSPSPVPSAAVTPRSSSPVPSKCVVPSLAAAKEENRKTAREPAIVVPSRYRQPSPVGGRRGVGSSPVGGRRGSMSPGGRRLSGAGGGGESGSGGGKKKVGVVVAGISRVSDALMGSGRGVRKSWEDNSGGGGLGEEKEKEKEKEKVKNKVDQQQAILRTQVAMSQRLSDVSREQQPSSEEEEAPRKEKQKTSKKVEVPPTSEKLKHLATKITVHDRKWTDGSIPFDTVSENLSKLGKEALQRKNIASVAAAEALEEALATESVIRCLSMFSDLCSSSKARNPLPTIDRFLYIYEDAMKWIPNAHSEAASIDPTTKPSSLWVEAALATDLQVVSLIDSKFSGKPAVPPATDPTRLSFPKKNSSHGTLAKTQAKVSTNTWTSGHCVGETVNFAKSLRREMQIWFMKFVEDALDVGFRLFGEVPKEDARGVVGCCKDNGRVAAVLSQLKRVNEWLDEVGMMPEEEVMLVEEKIERLKRKIYGFVITHIESAFDTSVSLTKA